MPEINSAARGALKILALRGASPSMADEPVCPNGYRHFMKWFKKALSQAEIQDFRPHDLRHTFGSRLTIAGVPLRTIQELMGHRDIGTTLRYSHLSDAHRRAAVEELVKPAPEGKGQTQKSTYTQTDTDSHALASNEKPTVM